MLLIWAIDLFLFCFRMKMTITKNKTLNEVDSGVDLEVVGVVGVVFKEDAMRVVVVVLEADAAATGVVVGTTMVIRVDVGATVVIGVVAEVAVILEAVVVILEAVVVVLGAVVVVSKAENLGVETIGITTDQENHGETMRIMIEEILRVVLIKESLLISRHHLKIKKSLLMINTK